MTIMSVPFCQVSLGYDPLQIQLTPCWSYSTVAQKAMDLQINGCHFQQRTPPSALDNKQRSSTLSTHTYHYTIKCSILNAGHFQTAATPLKCCINSFENICVSFSGGCASFVFMAVGKLEQQIQTNGYLVLGPDVNIREL